MYIRALALCLILTAAVPTCTTADSGISPAQVEEANRALAFEAAGDWAAALKIWENWKPGRCCIPGETQSQKAYHIAICAARIGQTERAVTNCLEAVFAPAGYAQPHVALLLLRFYQGAGQVSDLVRMVETFERITIAEYREKGYFQSLSEAWWRKCLPTRPIREALRIAELEQKLNLKELIEIAQDSTWSNTDTAEWSYARSDWRCWLAANALARLGDSVLESVASEMFAQRSNISWLIYAVGEIRATNALAILQKGARQEGSYNSGNFVRAICRRGAAGSKVLQELADPAAIGICPCVRLPAQSFLEKRLPCLASALDLELPQPKPGSLPAIYVPLK